MRITLVAVAALALAACEPEPVQSVGAGFDDFSALEAGRAEREAELRGGTTTLPLPQGPGPISRSELAAAGLPVASGPLAPGSDAPLAPTGGGLFGGGVAPGVAGGVAGSGPPGLSGSLGSGLGSIAAPTGAAISDEQDFAAVSGRESIESDAARLARQREAYQVIEPEALPSRPADTGPNIVAYALQTSNRVGERVYSRSGVNLGLGGQRGCGSYPSPDKAQEAFLEAGGPQRDRYGLDPDGDGFACGWNPAPFRAARGN